MKINQIITENFDGEYDDEAGMVQSNLYTIAKAAQGLLDTIDDHDNLPEWVQEKIAKVEGMMVTSWNYLQSQKAQGIDPQIAESEEKRCRQCGMKNCKCPGDSCKCKPIAGWIPGKGFKKAMDEAKSAHPQQAAKAIAMKKAGITPKNEDVELAEEFDLIESIIEQLAEHNGVDVDVIWEDLETLTEDELYAFAMTSEPIMESQGMAEASDPNFVGFMNKTLGDRVDATPKQPKTGHDWYDNAPTMSMDNMPSYKHAFKFGMSVLQSMAAETKQHFAEADNDELFSYLMKLARKKKFEPKYFVEEDMWEVTGLFKEIFHDPSMVEWEWSDLLRSTLNNQGVAESEAWQKANNRDKTDGMSQKSVNVYRREHPGSKLKTAVTTKPSKLKKGSKASKRRSSYCSRSRGQMKMHSISCSKTPDKAICKARRRWNC